MKDKNGGGENNYGSVQIYSHQQPQVASGSFRTAGVRLACAPIKLAFVYLI
jgi:hypothetical protein